jgi:AcrR family transcriptional regulator
VTDVKRVNKRTEKAQQTRRRILAAAGELFVEQGYGATSLQEVADRAGVAVQTIYFVFGNKRTLLKELSDVTIAGDDEPVATMDRPWFRDAMAARTAGAHLRAHVHGTRKILERVAAITNVWTTAVATDPEIATLWHYDEDPRFVVQATAAKALIAKPGARDDVTPEHAADLLFGLLSPELYLVFVRDRGWSPETWEQWAHHTLHAQLCSSRPSSDEKASG